MSTARFSLSSRGFILRLRHSFGIARETINEQPTLIVTLDDGRHQGYGEATTNSYYGVTLDSMRASLDKVRPWVESIADLDPTRLWEEAAALLPDDPFALCALDMAAWDLWGKRRGAPLYRLWGLSIANVPPSNFTIGIDTVEVMIAKLREMPGFPVYKIKLGTQYDLEIVRALRRETDVPFRVDANCGWSADETIANARELAQLNVEFIEQPLPAREWEGMRRVFRDSALPLIADESCICEGDVDRCRGYFHGVNIKLVKCGGLTPARRMIARARQLGLRTMVGCMTESTVGISAIAQLLPLLDYVDMDGAALLAADIATGATLDRGLCRYPDANGTGAQLLA
jgi:L-alanine-DL-glutamate epimerase-like enolase superfamily enzyme